MGFIRFSFVGERVWLYGLLFCGRCVMELFDEVCLCELGESKVGGVEGGGIDGEGIGVFLGIGGGVDLESEGGL